MCFPICIHKESSGKFFSDVLNPCLTQLITRVPFMISRITTPYYSGVTLSYANHCLVCHSVERKETYFFWTRTSHQSKTKFFFIFSLLPILGVFCDFVTYILKFSHFSRYTGEYNFSSLLTLVHSPIDFSVQVYRLLSPPWFSYT